MRSSLIQLPMRTVAVSLFLAACCSGSFAAASSVSESSFMQSSQTDAGCRGIIRDTDGNPVIGATVMIQGTTKGTVTEPDGSFTLAEVHIGDELIVQCLGYQNYTFTWKGNYANVVLEFDTQMLEETVVVGYGVQKKTNVTGAVSMVDSEVIESRPVANVTQALQGAIPGLNITTSSSGGDLNTSMNINIRGTGSISSSDSPLILIDGIEGDLNMVNPNDIESVSVLKDAASASIYGSRAAFGVILVTTKSGKEGKVRVSYSGDVRFSTATQVPDMLDSYSFAKYFNEAQRNADGTAVFTDDYLQKIQNFQAGMYTDPSTPEYYGFDSVNAQNKWSMYTSSFANTDWFDEFYNENVPSTQHNISVSGGTAKFNYLISGSYLLQNGLIAHGHDELDRYNTTVKLGAQLADWFRVDYLNRWSRKVYEKPQYLTGLFFHNIARRWPTVNPVDPNGHWTEGMEIAELEDGGEYHEYEDNYVQQIKFTIEPVKDWKIYLDGALGITNTKSTTSKFPVYHYDADNQPFMRDSGYGTTSYVYDNRYRQDYYAVNIYTDYARSFGKHNGKIMAGFNYEKYVQDSLWGSGENLTTEDYPYLSQAQDQFKTGDSYWNRAVAGYFARFNYDYDGKYLFEANVRYDGSSRFVGDKRWAWFPSFSAGWNIAKENFFRPAADKVSMLKLRLSWGQLGNTSSEYNSFSDWYPFYQQQSVGIGSGGWLLDGNKTNVASMSSIVSDLMTWETIETWDAGFDWAMFDNRFTGTFDWFNRTTRNMIGPAPELGSALGTTAPQVNNCDMLSRGWELELGWRDQIKDFSYGIRFNLSDSRQKILSYPNDSYNLSTYYSGMYLNEIWGYETEGIANSQEEMDVWLENNMPNWGSNWGAGDIMYKDLDGDGKVTSGDNTLDNPGDRKVIGNTTPRYRFGLNLDFAWKGIDFSIFFQGVAKRDWAFSATDTYFWGASGVGMWQAAGFKEHMDYWTEDNHDAYYPKPIFNDTKNTQVQSGYLQSAAYLRCKNIQIGYTLPQKWTRKAGIQSCRIYLSCDNAFTITGLSSVFDPEAFGGYGDEGYGSGKTYPLQRTIALGLNINF